MARVDRIEEAETEMRHCSIDLLDENLVRKSWTGSRSAPYAAIYMSFSPEESEEGRDQLCACAKIQFPANFGPLEAQLPLVLAKFAAATAVATPACQFYRASDSSTSEGLVEGILDARTG